ncbi:VCBS repeat-containing protein [Roseivirga sp. E12]|uniref:VCBS repeat-containing protein n=1 Tax=Roseivirga sp. E12 TaxID=2819237 RepID=UPI001ABC6FCB|nr:VCBS repeat-containing protein [Roseivirga sp. E12]MBO3699429.1 VCBS repeat-containing protein [Roseivirga sp. E12]
MNKSLRSLAVFFSLGILFSSCSEPEQNDGLFKLLSPKESGIRFNNEMHENREINLLSFAPIYNGAGVAVGDLNNDGLEDIFFTGNFVSSRLYLNKGDLKFDDITKEAGVSTEAWCNGVSIVDINADGFNDIYIAVSNPDSTKRENLLFINNGDLTFTEQAEAYGLNDNGHSTHSAFFDYDLDGDLDMYLLTYGNNEGTDLKLVNKKIIDGTGLSNDRLYRNNGDNTFTNVTLEAGILVEGYGLGIAVNDLNNDLYPDLYISNDFLFDDIVYINNQDGTFTDQSKVYLKHTSHFGMGVDVQDFNNDLMPDVVQVDMMPEDNYRQKKILGPMHYDFFNLSIKEGYTPQYMRNTLQMNQGEKGFSEIGQFAGINETDWSWAPVFADYDANGEKDLIITNGFRRNVTDWDFRNYISEQLEIAKGKGQDPDEVALAIVKKTNDLKLPNYAYSYNGDLTFTDVTTDWGLSAPTWSNGMAYGDFDQDGDLDLVISNIDDYAYVYENTLDQSEAKPYYLKVKLDGTEENPEGIGAKVIVQQGEIKRAHYQSKSRGYLSNVTSEIYFGFGDNNQAVNVTVIWPNGQSETKETTLNTSLSFQIEDSSENTSIHNTLTSLTSGNLASAYGLDHITPENEYVDFYYEPLLPHRLSQSGVALSKGDVNGDGLEDLFVGGSSGNAGYIFIQTRNGKFRKSELGGAPNAEDTDAVFLDFDKDGDLDLYVTSGSNEFEPLSREYQDRLYINNGRGKFRLGQGVLPEMLTSSGSVSVSDFDNDGDVDLFVGGRLDPKKYPLPGTSYILLNEGGSFSDITEEVAQGLQKIGMVTDSEWADFDGDNDIDLILTGEFMPITVFLQEDGKFTNASTSLGLDTYTGWWNSLHLEDLNKDGKLDVIAGNLGENTKYDVSKDQPISVFAKDYDDNGMIDAIMSCFIGGEEHVLHSKSTLEQQVIRFKKRYVKHEEFAKATFAEVIPPEIRDGAYVLQANTFSHMAFLSAAEGYKDIPLPKATQIAPIQAIVELDGQYLISGNDYGTEVTVGQYDASHGFTISYDVTKEKFELIRDSKYRASGNIKSSLKVKVGSETIIVHSANGESLYVSKSN